MLTEEEKEILHRAGQILYRECSNIEECKNCPAKFYGVCHSIDSHDGFDEIGKALQII
jgi:hypothetical protein